MILPFPALQFLSGLTDVEEFLSRHWETAPIHLGSERGAAPFTLDFMDAIRAATAEKAVELLGAVKDADRPPSDPFDPDWPRVRGGRSARVNAVHRFAPSLNAFRESLERELSHAVSVNLYVSPPASRGLDTHRDGHSVFVVQVAGSKRWRIWPRAGVPLDHRPRVGFETYRQRPQDYRGTMAGGHILDMGDEPPEIDLTLETGSVLYVPRGMPHEVWTEDDFSAHLTIGIHLTTWADVVIAAIGDAALDAQSPLREAVPVGSFRTLPQAASLPKTLAPFIQAVADRPAAEALQALAVRWVNTGVEAPPSSGPVTVSGEEWVTRPHPLCFIETAGACTLAGFRSVSDTLSMPPAFHAALRFVATIEPAAFQVNQLPGLTERSRSQLCADLLSRGFLVKGKTVTESTGVHSPNPE